MLIFVLFYFIILIIFDEEYKLWNMQLSGTSCHFIFLVKIFSSASCSQTSSVYVPALTWQPKFYAHTELQSDYFTFYKNLVYLIRNYLNSRPNFKVYKMASSMLIVSGNLKAPTLWVTASHKASFWIVSNVSKNMQHADTWPNSWQTASSVYRKFYCAYVLEVTGISRHPIWFMNLAWGIIHLMYDEGEEKYAELGKGKV
jgi:hypothetical protein